MSSHGASTQIDLIGSLAKKEDYEKAFFEFKSLFPIYSCGDGVEDISTLLYDCKFLASSVPHTNAGEKFANAMVEYISKKITDYCKESGGVHCSCFTRFLAFIERFNYEEKIQSESEGSVWVPIADNSTKKNGN